MMPFVGQVVNAHFTLAPASDGATASLRDFPSGSAFPAMLHSRGWDERMQTILNSPNTAGRGTPHWVKMMYPHLVLSQSLRKR